MTETEKAALDAIVKLLREIDDAGQLAAEALVELEIERGVIAEAAERMKVDLDGLGRQQAASSAAFADLTTKVEALLKPAPPDDGEDGEDGEDEDGGDGEGPSPAAATSWPLLSPDDAETQHFALDTPLRGPGKVIVTLSAEHPQVVNLQEIAGFHNCNQGNNAGNSLRLFWRDLPTGDVLAHIDLEVSPAESVLGLVQWWPGMSGPLVSEAAPVKTNSTDEVRIDLAGLPAGALVVAAVADNWGVPDVWACSGATEVQDAARSDAGGHGQAVAVRTGAPAGARAVTWRRSVPAGRIVAVAAAWDVGGQVVADPDMPPPPPPGPPAPDGLEPEIGDATKIALAVGAQRQTITEVAFGLGSPGGQSPSETIKRFGKILVTDIGVNGARLNGASATYVPTCKVLKDLGVDHFHVTGYQGDKWIGNPGGAAAAHANGIADLVSKGVAVTSCSCENEPAYRTWGRTVARSAHQALRSALDSRVLKEVRLVGPEFANTDSWSKDCARDLADLYGGTVAAAGCHSYGLGLDEELSQLVLSRGVGFQQRECGYMSFTGLAARYLNDRTRGCEAWTAHRAHQTKNTTDANDRSQSLILYDGSTPAWYHAFRLISLALPVGTRVRLVTRTGVNGDDAKFMHWKRTYSSPIYAICGERSDGAQAVVVLNYGASKLQATLTLPHLAGKSGTLMGQKTTSAGKSGQVAVALVKGTLRTPALAKSELLTVWGKVS